MKKLQVYFTQEQYDKISDKKDETGIKMAEIVRRAVDFYFNTEAKKQEGDKVKW